MAGNTGRWFRMDRVRVVASGMILYALLALAGCSGAENDTGGSAGSESANAGGETTRQATVSETTAVETTAAPAAGAPNEQDDPEDEDDDRATPGSSGNVRDREPDRQESRPASGSTGERGSGSGGLASLGRVVTVSRVVDGDTIEVTPAVDGIRDVRLIGVDTPETYGREEPLGPQAISFTTSALSGERVALQLGEERVDPYGRALAYVWTSPVRRLINSFRPASTYDGGKSVWFAHRRRLIG